MKRKLDRPPSFMSRATLAAELDVPETKIDVMVQKGIIPKPIPLVEGVERFDWIITRSAISLKGGGAALTEDPYLAGARNATAAR